MSNRRTAIAVALLTLSSSLPAWASGPAGLFGAAFGPPALPPPPAPDAPPPSREADEYARRSWELFPEAGVGAPFCRGATFGAGHCGDTGHGSVLGGGALYRITPYVALGATLSLASFHLDGVPAPAFSRASFAGLLVRGYFAERGVVDPYVEMGLGRGSASTGYADGAADVRIESAGPAAMAGAGVDFWVMPHLKIGPALSYRWTWLTEMRTCVGARCESAAVADWGAVGSYVSLSFVATVAFGREM